MAEMNSVVGKPILRTAEARVSGGGVTPWPSLREIGLLAIVLLIAIVIRGSTVQYVSTGPDRHLLEDTAAQAKQGPRLTGTTMSGIVGNHSPRAPGRTPGPIMYWVLWPFLRYWPDGQGVFWCGVIAGVLVVSLAYLVLREFCGVLVAWVGSMTYATSEYYVYFSHRTAGWLSVGLCALMGSFYFLACDVTRPRRGYRCIVAIACGFVAVQVHIVYIVPLAVAFAAALAWGWRPARRSTVMGALVVVVMSMPFICYQANHNWEDVLAVGRMIARCAGAGQDGSNEVNTTLSTQYDWSAFGESLTPLRYMGPSEEVDLLQEESRRYCLNSTAKRTSLLTRLTKPVYCIAFVMGVGVAAASIVRSLFGGSTRRKWYCAGFGATVLLAVQVAMVLCVALFLSTTHPYAAKADKAYWMATFTPMLAALGVCWPRYRWLKAVGISILLGLGMLGAANHVLVSREVQRQTGLFMRCINLREAKIAGQFLRQRWKFPADSLEFRVIEEGYQMPGNDHQADSSAAIRMFYDRFGLEPIDSQVPTAPENLFVVLKPAYVPCRFDYGTVVTHKVLGGMEMVLLQSDALLRARRNYPHYEGEIMLKSEEGLDLGMKVKIVKSERCWLLAVRAKHRPTERSSSTVLRPYARLLDGAGREIARCEVSETLGNGDHGGAPRINIMRVPVLPKDFVVRVGHMGQIKHGLHVSPPSEQVIPITRRENVR